MLIVVISPYPAERSALDQLLSATGHRVIAVSSRVKGIRAAARGQADVIIADAQVVGFEGAALVRDMTEHGIQARLILLCPRATRCATTPEYVCLPKPIDLAQLDHHIGGQSLAERVA